MPAVAQDAAAYGASFRRAEIRERALGDLDEALDLYRIAAREAPSPADRARAELRAASCLLRLGRASEAVELASPWASAQATGVPVELRSRARSLVAAAGETRVEPAGVESVPAEPGVDPARVEQLEDELDQARLRLERSLGEAAGARQESEGLAAELRAREREIDELRRKLPPPDPETPEEALRLRRELLERQRRKARESAAAWTRYAALLHRDGRFAEAREILYDALARDPENAEASALLARVVAPLGDRERLHLRIKEVLALAREVRLARLTSEADYLLRQGRRLQERSEVAASIVPLEKALALLRVPDVAERAPESARPAIEALLRSAESAGFARAPQPTPTTEALPASWSAALREMLSAAGEEVAQGLRLRFHDLDTLLPAESVPLPPVPASEPPAGWTLSTQVADAAGLLAAWLRGSERVGLGAPGASLDVEGATVVALADDAVQARLSDRLAQAALSVAPGVDVEIAVLRLAPGAWAERLAALGLDVHEIEGGARTTTLSPDDAASLLEDVTGGTAEVLARGRFRAAHRSPFRLAGGSTSRSLSVDVLAIAGAEAGLALDVQTTWRPPGHGDAAPLRQRSLSGGLVAPGGALAIHALADPAAPGRDLVVLARLGRPVAEATSDAPERVVSPPLPGGREAAEHLLPRSIARPEEIVVALLPTPGAPIPSRTTALRARLEAAAEGATSLELRGDRVLVVGPQSAHDGVRALLDRLGGAGELQRFGVEVYVLPRDAQSNLFRALPTVGRARGASFASAVVSDGRSLASARRILASGARRVPLTENVLATPPTIRHDAAHVVRTPYRVDLDTAPGEETSWGRAETGVVDQGFLLALRPFGRDGRGRDDVDVSLRMIRVPELAERERSTALGDVRLVEPKIETLAGDLRVDLGPRDVLVIADLPSPYSPTDEIRFVLLVTPLR